jgi:tail fiber protein gp32
MDITGANATYTIVVAVVFPSPQQLQGFAADDIFTSDPLESTETLMGVDGKLSAGFVFVPVNQEIRLQADSISNAIFDQWYQQQTQSRQVFPATGVVTLPALNQKWSLQNGFLVRYTPMPSAKKLLQPRQFGIRWESVSTGPS